MGFDRLLAHDRAKILLVNLAETGRRDLLPDDLRKPVLQSIQSGLAAREGAGRRNRSTRAAKRWPLRKAARLGSLLDAFPPHECATISATADTLRFAWTGLPVRNTAPRIWRAAPDTG